MLTALPYVWPFDGTLVSARTALLLCVDTDEAPDDSDVLDRLAALAEWARRRRIVSVLSVRAGASLPAGLPMADLTVARSCIGGMTESDLDLTLRTRGVSHLLIVGLPLELGADTTMRQANDLGYECLLLPDGCTGLAPETFAGAVKSVQMSGGVFGAVATVAELIEAFP